jgi:hypothetical protein
MIDKTKITVTKLDAARRQLRTAIRLWFNDGDPVAIHTLAFAAYEIIHVVSKKHNRTRPLIFDTPMIKDQYRSDWNKKIKEHANFFKHANIDPDGSIEFAPALSILFLMAATAGIRLLSGRHSIEEFAFVTWFFYHRPDWLNPRFRKALEDSIPVEHLSEIRKVRKSDFLKAVTLAHKNTR